MQLTAYSGEMRGVENQAHEHSTEGASDGNRGDPCDDKEPDSLEVDGL